MKTFTRRLLILALCEAFAFTGETAAQGAKEVVTREAPFTQDVPLKFTAGTSQVTVPVVVRDKNGKIVGNLQKEDFQLFDRGKPQVITSFSVERAGDETALLRWPLAGAPTGELAMAPDRYVGFFFDDVNIQFEDLSRTRTLFQRFIATRLKPGDRAAIFTSSGLQSLNFTGDRDKLNKTVLKIVPHPPYLPVTCPPISAMEAYLVGDMFDVKVTNAVAQRAIPMCARDLHSAISAARDAAAAVLNAMELSVRDTLAAMNSAVRRMAEAPGQRVLIIVSGGMIRPNSMIRDQEDTIDLAVRSHVVINGLDAPGLIASVGFIPLQRRVARNEALWEMADGTGGQFVHDTNDLFGGFERLAAAPEVTYLLGFSPQNLKLNGKFHALKVKVKHAGLSVQARAGYRAPTHLASAAETAREEIREAVFSRGEIRDIGISLETGFVKRSPAEATLSVVSRIDVSQLHYRKADGRNIDDIELVCALFDRNGVYIDSLIRTIRLRLLDDTLRNRMGGGIPSRSDFKVPPGTYAIRVVARDSEGEMMAAQNGEVVIPR